MLRLRFFHGSNKDIKIGSSLKTPTGYSCFDVIRGGVVYLTSDCKKAKRYGRYVFVIETLGDSVLSYSEARKMQKLAPKKLKYEKDVFVTLPENTKVVEKMSFLR